MDYEQLRWENEEMELKLKEGFGWIWGSRKKSRERSGGKRWKHEAKTTLLQEVSFS